MTDTNLAQALDRAITLLRTPNTDVAAQILAAEPAIHEADQAWIASGKQAPNAEIADMARSLRAELSTLRMKLEARRRALARVQRALVEAQGGTYDKTAARLSRAPATPSIEIAG